MAEPLPFGRWLRLARAKDDLTQELLAERVGCAVQTIRTFERGLRRPSRAMAERLADVLRIPEDERATFLRVARAPVQPAATPPVHSLEATPAAERHAQLPRPSGPLIGREAERQTTIAELLAPTGRLVTLIGPGGFGKTRLALQVAAEVADGMAGAVFADGVAVVTLAPIADVANLGAAIAAALDLPPTGTIAPEAHVLAHLRKRTLLLVLDNLEHLLGPEQGGRLTDLIGAILREAPGVRLLTTSRERLRVQDERVVDIGGLGLPAAGDGPVERSDAVLLFVERARQSLGSFALDPENRDAVVRICRLLAGCPLAIELAAAWVRTLSCEEIADEITRSLDFLALSGRDVDPRHRSMRAVLDHSWALLRPEERQVLMRLSVFRGGCRREAAEAVAQATLPVLAALIDTSLLSRTSSGRYELHELLRQYGQEQLAHEPAAAASAHDRHAAYFAALLEAREPALKGPQQQAVAAELVAEIDNIRAAWKHACAYRQIERLQQLVDRAALLYFFEVRGQYHEGETFCREAADALAAAPPMTPLASELYGYLRTFQGWFMSGRERRGARRALMEQGVALLRGADNLFFRFHAAESLGYVMFVEGDQRNAERLQREAHVLARHMGDPWTLAVARWLGAILDVDGEPERAYTNLRESTAHARAVGDPRLTTSNLVYLGMAATASGRGQEAEQIFHEVLASATGAANRFVQLHALNGLAMAACAREAWDEALAYCDAAQVRAQELSTSWGRARTLAAQARAEAGRGDRAAASRSFREAIMVGSSEQVLPSVVSAWLGLATLQMEEASWDETLLAILALVRGHPSLGSQAREASQALWAQLEPRIPSEVLASAEQRAARLSIDDLAPLLTAYGEHRAAAELAAREARPEPWAARRESAAAFGDALSVREREVLQLLAQGHSNQQIANRLVLAIGTVKRHVNSILSKLQVESRLAAVARARELRLID